MCNGKAAFLVETGSASRRAMSADEVEHFLWSIEKNDPNAFGLTKLSELRLNDPVDVAARGGLSDYASNAKRGQRFTLKLRRMRKRFGDFMMRYRRC